VTSKQPSAENFNKHSGNLLNHLLLLPVCCFLIANAAHLMYFEAVDFKGRIVNNSSERRSESSKRVAEGCLLTCYLLSVIC
jgi:hypothetical protein